MQSVGSQVNDIMWRHNGGEINELWNDQLNVSIANVTKDQAGVYSCFVSGRESEQLHGIMRLIVRGQFSSLHSLHVVWVENVMNS